MQSIFDQQMKDRWKLEYIDSVLDTVSRAESERELAQIREELTEQDIHTNKELKTAGSTLPRRQTTSSDSLKF